MLKYGEDTGLPGTYRITLALSVALLLHTLLMATFPFDLPEHNNNPVTVSVQLVPSGSAPSAADTPAQTHSPVRATPFRIEDTPATRPSRDIPTTKRRQPRAVPEPAPEKVPTADTSSRSQSQPQPEQQSEPSRPTRASTPSMAGKPSSQEKESEQEQALRSDAPSEESSYLSLLAQTIGRKAKIPKLDNFEKGQELGIELELNLMANGALVGARITRSSGNDSLDRRVYRAALAASPYPEPPSSGSGQQRFRVEVRYIF